MESAEVSLAVRLPIKLGENAWARPSEKRMHPATFIIMVVI
jgi:hypothetical protein